jgi:hypothetical protein
MTKERHTGTVHYKREKNEIRRKRWNSDTLRSGRTDGNDPIVLQPRRCMSRHRITASNITLRKRLCNQREKRKEKHI